MTTTFFYKRYGSYQYQDTVSVLAETVSVVGRNTKTAGFGGRATSGTLFDAARYVLTGLVAGDDNGLDINDPASIRANWDDFKEAHQPGIARQFLLDSDRYANCEVESDIHADDWDGMPNRGFSVTLISYEDPPVWSVTPTVVILAVGVNTFQTLGTGAADPEFQVTVSVADPAGLLTISNADGDSIAFCPPSNGVYRLNTTNETILNAAGTDVSQSMQGDFWRLLKRGADNIVTISMTGAITVTAAYCTYQDRWY